MTVAIHAGQTVPIGTLKAILAAASLTPDELRDLLQEGEVRRYTVVPEFDPEAGSYAVTVSVLPGCTSMGKTVEEALVNAKEAITGHIVTLEEVGETVPEEPEGAVIIVAGFAA